MTSKRHISFYLQDTTNMYIYVSISHRDQLNKLRGDIAVKGQELERIKAELAAEKFQKYNTLYISI